MSLRISFSKYLLLAVIAALLSFSLHASCAASKNPIVIRAGEPIERDYLVENDSVLLEMGLDPLAPYIRLADGQTMHYVYRFSPGKGSMAYLLLNITSQFLISVSSDNGNIYTPVSEKKACELLGTRVLIDLTPFLAETDSVLVKFEDRYKEDGWGSLLTEIRYYQFGKAPVSRLILKDGWMLNGQHYSSGDAVASSGTAKFSTSFDAPSGWSGNDLAIYFSGIRGTPITAKLNSKEITLKPTWDHGFWAAVGSSFKLGTANNLEIDVKPDNGKVGLSVPVRVGLRDTACVVPVDKTFEGKTVRTNHEYEPYTPGNINFLAGNFMQCLFDKRYNLLAFQPDEKMTVHYLHDTFRSLVALAEEERFTPVVRLELARKLYQGCKGGLMPGGEYLYSFKHDERPIDIRPMENTSELVLAQKMDNRSFVSSVGVDFMGSDVNWEAAKDFKDTSLKRAANKWSFTRIWKDKTRNIRAHAVYYLGGSDMAPSIEFALDGKGPVRIKVGKLAENGMWFTPGSWGPEALVFQSGKEVWANKANSPIANPNFNYLFVRGGNGDGKKESSTPDYTYCKAYMVMWDKSPVKLIADTIDGGRTGRLFSDITLEYENKTPTKVRLTLMPFAGYPDSLKAPHIIAENILRTGKMGVGFYDPVWTSNSNGIGPDGMAAAAYLFKKYNTPEAKEAEDLAVKSMQATIDLDMTGTRTNELYYLLRGCTYLHLMGHTEFDEWARIWADRFVDAQEEDGSWEWLNYQLRVMEALLNAYYILGDQKYLDAVSKGLSTMEYRSDGNLYWHDQVQYYDDFSGATTCAIYGYLGMKDMVQKAINARLNYIDDRGCSPCSDLNPYMLGMCAGGLNLKTGNKLILGLTDFVIYDDKEVKKLSFPTCYMINPYHPLAGNFSFDYDK